MLLSLLPGILFQVMYSIVGLYALLVPASDRVSRRAYKKTLPSERVLQKIYLLYTTRETVYNPSAQEMLKTASKAKTSALWKQGAQGERGRTDTRSATGRSGCHQSPRGERRRRIPGPRNPLGSQLSRTAVALHKLVVRARGAEVQRWQVGFPASSYLRCTGPRLEVLTLTHNFTCMKGDRANHRPQTPVGA